MVEVEGRIQSGSPVVVIEIARAVVADATIIHGVQRMATVIGTEAAASIPAIEGGRGVTRGAGAGVTVEASVVRAKARASALAGAEKTVRYLCVFHLSWGNVNGV